MKKFLLLAVLLSSAALAQNAPSGVQRVQGAPDGTGDPLQVTIVGANGSDVTATAVNTAQVNGVTTLTGNGVTGTGSQRVTVASDNTPFPVKLDQTTPGTTNATSLKYLNATAVSVNNGTVDAGTQRVVIASDNTAFSVNSTTTGNVAGAASDSGNPVKVGCKYNSTRPTYTDGQRSDCQSDTRGAQYVTVAAPDGGSIATANGMMTQPYGSTTTNWSYSSGTSPILSNTTTAVTIKASAGGGVINYIDSCQIGSTALGASVPLALRDGAGGTVKFAVRPPTAGWLTPWTVNFQPPLKGTAATLWEVVTTTADTSGTFDVNCQGHTGS